MPMFYGYQVFYFTLFDLRGDLSDILQWLRRIGPANARALRDLVIVYRKQSFRRVIERYVMPLVSERGVRTGEGVVRTVGMGDFQRRSHRIRYCELCVVRVLIRREKDGVRESRWLPAVRV